MTEETFLFGPDRNLPGTLTVPTGGATRGVAVLLFNSGVIHRVGPHRINVRIARALAAEGFATLRFDLSTVGDGTPPRNARPFDLQAVGDLRAAIAALRARTGVEAVAIYGICSGAVQAFDTARAEPAIRGLFLQDGYAFPTWRSRVRRYTLPLLTDPARVLRSLAKRLRRAGAGDGAPAVAASLAGEDAPPAGSAGWRPAAFAEALDALAARGTLVRLLCTGSILELYNYPGQFEAKIPVRSPRDRIRCDFAPDIDHTVSNAHAQRALIGRVVDWARDVDAAG